MKKKTVIFRLVLASVALAHLIIGITASLPGGSVTEIAQKFYSASINTTPELEHVAQMFGVYMLAIGILAAFAVCNPNRNVAITYGIITLLMLRVLQRIILANDAMRLFHIDTTWYWAQTIFFGIIALTLFVLRPKEERSV